MIIQHTNFGAFSVIRCGYHEGEYNFGSHIHQFCEFILCLDGEIEITVEGKTELAGAGDITVILPFQIHSFRTPKYCHIWICVFSNDFINGLIPFEELYQGRERSTFTPGNTLRSYIDAEDFIGLCMSHWKNRECKPWVYKLKSIFHLIMSEYFNTAPVISSNCKDNTLQKILIYISTHFKENINQSTVGKALGYSPRYVSNCFLAIPKMNFRTMLNSLRIEHAKGLLLNTDMNIIDIGLDSGFSSERSFHRSFLDIVGMTPGEYRRARK